MKTFLWFLSVCLLLCSEVVKADVALHNFEEISIWKPNADGGLKVEITGDAEHTRDGGGMRVRYVDGTPHWGNLTGPCQVPKDARALRFFVYKYSAAPGAAMHVWLFEPDGDAWVQKVPLGKDSLADAAMGWHEVRMPIAGFHFEPRGKGTREMIRVDRMLIGCNFADLEVTVASMKWETGSGGKPIPLPHTDGLKVERGPRGNIAILDMASNLPEGFRTAHPPQKMGEALREGQFGVTLLKPGDCADATIVTKQNFDCIVLPFGPYFPLEAKETFLTYLKAGGSFLSTDGYAFDSLLVLTDSGWSTVGSERTAEEMDKPESAPATAMNTRTGQPGDAMGLSPEQIGVFDPSFALEHATELRLAEGWDAKERHGTRSLQYEFSRPVEGFSACGLTGYTSAVFPPVYRRWIPALEAYSGPGGPLRGTALSIMHNYAGPFVGSSWAFSGITSGEDLFLATPERRGLLRQVVSAITEKVFLHELTSDFACYQKDETATAQVRASNHGRIASQVEVVLSAAGREIAKRAITLSPGSTETVEGRIAVNSLKTDFCQLKATLLEDGRVVDAMESAFCVWDDKVVASGPKIGWKENYMTVDGRSTFLIGSNQTGMMYYSANENPAVWDRDFRSMCEHNVHILRILHFSPYSKGGYEGRPTNNPLDLAERPQRLRRQMDAIVQLAQKHRVAIFLSLHDWMGTVLTDEQLKVQTDWNHFWAARYRNVPGIFFDVQNEPSVEEVDRPDVVALWNQWLQKRYGSDTALREAWSKNPPEDVLPNVPLGKRTDEWDDVRSADRKRFEAELLNRWVKANVDGIKTGNPNALTCVGYLPSMPPADRILGTRCTDFSNMHYYGPVDSFPQEFKTIDRRRLGKGFSIGEMGAQEAHDRRVNGQFGEPANECVYRFQTYLHYAAGMGAAFLDNWDWKDFDEMVFPWGVMRHCSNIAKPWLHTLTQGSLLLSFVEPTYESPEVFILVPDSNRIGPRFNELHQALARSVDLMLDQRVDFGMINEEDLDHLPTSAKGLVWPIPYCPTDEAFDRVLAWVKGGGTLYLSGDVSFDRTRKPTRGDRWKSLGLPESSPTSPFAAPEAAWQNTPIETSVGKGKVFYVPFPMELRGHNSDRQVYARFLTLANIGRIRVEPENAPVRALSIPTREGGRLVMLARTTSGDDLLPVSLPDSKVAVELAGRGFAFVAVNGKGDVIAAESQGAIVVGGQRIAEAKGHYGVCSLDDVDLRRSLRILVVPHQAERVNLEGLTRLRGAQCHVGPPSGIGGRTSPFVSSVSFTPEAGQAAIIAAPEQLKRAIEGLRRRVELRWEK